MGLDDVARDGQTDAGTLLPSSQGIPASIKRIEDLSQIVWGDSDAVIGDRELDSLDQPSVHANLATAR